VIFNKLKDELKAAVLATLYFAVWIGVLTVPKVLVALVLEKAFESRQKHGDFMSSLIVVFRHGEIHHVWANTICLTGALLGYNILSALRRHLGEGALNQIFHVTFAA